MINQAVFQVGPQRGKETAVVELQCSQDPEDPAFLIAAHFLLAGDTEVMVFLSIPVCLSTLVHN